MEQVHDGLLSHVGAFFETMLPPLSKLKETNAVNVVSNNLAFIIIIAGATTGKGGQISTRRTRSCHIDTIHK